MSVGTRHASAAARSLGNAEERALIIQRQLNYARRKIRWIELTASTLWLIGWWLAVILVLIATDHWFFALPGWVRWLAVFGLMAFSAWYVVRAVWPLLRYSIHPLYVAKQLEEAKPWLKNSLLNFLFLRRQTTAVAPAVLEAVERAAAENLSKIPVDDSLDRTRMVRGLAVVAALLTVGGLYQVFSPKSSWQSLERILMPWRQSLPPSRVQLLEVEPKDKDVPYGERVEIRAVARGVRAADRAVALLSTDDGSIVNQPVELTSDKERVTFFTTLPPGEGGLRQSLSYQLVIGDARTAVYRLTVLQKPIINVYRVDYEFPEYMQRPPLSREGQGDIEAPEGTQVTLWARANMPIREAYLEWDPDERGKATQGYKLMQVDGQVARVMFRLELTQDRRQSQHASYQVRYVAADGRESRDAEVHPIRVIPDLAPVVEILAPKQRRVEVPLNGELTIEVRAVDPDFALVEAALVGQNSNGESWRTVLLQEPTGWRGQFVGKVAVRPQENRWKVGDVITYHGEARDNRHDVSGTWRPNEARTADYQLLVTPAVQPPQVPSHRAKAERSESPATQPNESPPDAAAEKTQSGKGGTEDGKEEDSKNADQPPGEKGGAAATSKESRDAQDDKTPPMNPPMNPAEGQSAGEAGQASAQPSPGKNSTDAPGAKERRTASGQSPAQPENSGAREALGASPADPAGTSTQPGSGQTPRQDKPTDGQPTRSPANAASDSTGSPTPPDTSGSGTDAPKSSPEAEGKGSPEDGMPAVGPGSSQSENRQQPVYDGTPDAPVKDLHDGDVFELVRRYMEQQQKWPDKGRPEPPTTPNYRSASNDGREQMAERPGADASDEPQGDRGEHPSGGAQSKTAEKDTPDATSRDDNVASAEDRPSQIKGTACPKEPGQSAGRQGTKPPSPANAEAADETQSSEASPSQSPPTDADSPADASSKPERPSPTKTPSGSQTKGHEQPGDGQPSFETPSGDNAPMSGSATTTSGRATGGGNIGQTQPGTVPDTPATRTTLPSPEVEPNLEYARKATDLVLEYLKDQQQNPDPKLLERLGWTADQLAEFTRRWQQLKKSAESDERKRAELDDVLRSLGLRPPADQLRQGASVATRRTQQAESADRSAPPGKYRQLFDAFRKSAARAVEEPSP